jgi:superfamily II RNA helicase
VDCKATQQVRALPPWCHVTCVAMCCVGESSPLTAFYGFELGRRPCHVVYTDYRPTPLEHYVFPCGGKELYLAVDARVRHTTLNPLETRPNQSQSVLNHYHPQMR